MPEFKFLQQQPKTNQGTSVHVSENRSTNVREDKKDDDRGRRRDREDAEGDHNGEGKEAFEAADSPRKRSRSRKSLDKKFYCPHEGCGRRYSLAEHLYRHQLNRMFSAINQILLI